MGNSFKATFEKELKRYIASGKQQFSYERGFKVEGKFVQNDEGGNYDTNSVYATANEKEMFAECYTLMMLGDCQSKEHILKYFPETFKAAQTMLAEIRAKSDDERYNRFHV